MSFLITCEHGSPLVPAALAEVFGLDAGHSAEPLAYPEGYDVGARELAETWARRLACPLVSAPYNPLVVDCNRPAGHRKVFSQMTANQPAEVRERLLREVHRVHERNVVQAIEEGIRRDGRVIHLAVHTFAPFDPEPSGAAGATRPDAARRTDLGLSYDPSRVAERDLCADWYLALYDSLPMLRVRRNYPIRGIRERLTQRLRRRFSGEQYLGIETQLNRAWCARSLPVTQQVTDGILDALCDLVPAKRRHVA